MGSSLKHAPRSPRLTSSRRSRTLLSSTSSRATSTAAPSSSPSGCKASRPSSTSACGRRSPWPSTATSTSTRSTTSQSSAPRACPSRRAGMAPSRAWTRNEGWWLDPKSSDFGPNGKYLQHNVEEAKKLALRRGLSHRVRDHGQVRHILGAAEHLAACRSARRA